MMRGPESESPARVRCLLVDDLEENLIALGALMRSDSVEVLAASSGTQALELLLTHDVALVLLDVQMPEMDGFEVAELMRGSERTRHIPIIFITAGAHDQNRLFRGYDSGAVDFLHKPVDVHILRNKAEVFFDLHRRKQQIAQQLYEREQTLRINEMFMAVLGHDLRSPLGAIRLSAQLVQRLSADARVYDVASRILASSDHMRDMIEDLLDVARARLGGGIPVDVQPVDLGVIVQRAVQEQRLLHPTRVIETTQLGDLGGQWDADRLSQLASNLLGNALKHGLADAPVRLELDGSLAHSVEFAVNNMGAIPAELLPSMFDPFQTSRRSGARKDGLGLGLYIAQQIAKAHGGTIAVQSDPGAGTSARVSLPRFNFRSHDVAIGGDKAPERSES